MKKLLFVLSFVSLVGQGFAQNPIPNNSFENWSGNPMDPDGWTTFNGFTPGSVVRVSPGFVGSYAMKVVATFNSITNQNNAGLTTVGFPITTRPVALTGVYRNDTIMPNDSCTIDLVMFNGGTPIGTAHLGFVQQGSVFRFFSAPISYTSMATPDSALIVVLSSDGTNPQAGTQIILDNLEFDGTNTTGIHAAASTVPVSLYPNPASSEAFVICDAGQSSDVVVKLYNTVGALVKVVSNQPGQSRIPLAASDLENGIYFYSVTVDAVPANAGKLVVNR
jgi:hypothetical protein